MVNDKHNDTPIDDFEQHLRDQLAPRSAPAGFADRVMARSAPQPRRAPLSWRPVWSWTAVAAVLALMAAGGVEHDRQQRIEGERARAQVLLALRITGATLHDVQQKISTEENLPNHPPTEIDNR